MNLVGQNWFSTPQRWDQLSRIWCVAK